MIKQLFGEYLVNKKNNLFENYSKAKNKLKAKQFFDNI
jgi:hypothetical protein